MDWFAATRLEAGIKLGNFMTLGLRHIELLLMPTATEVLYREHSDSDL